MQAVNIVTIKSLNPLFKNGEEATNIQIANFEENGFDVVVQKNLYALGDKAIFIQPDYCLPDVELFDTYIRPSGDEKKSMLGKIEGKPRRIRAKKFNFSKEINGDPVYSYGILLPITEVSDFIKLSVNDVLKEMINLDEILDITKYEEPESTLKGGVRTKGGGTVFPSGIYKTDESNIYNKIGQIEFPIMLYGTEKIDGSSITVGVIDNKPFIASRNIVKPLEIRRQVGIRKKTLIERLMFWKKIDLAIYETKTNTDDFVVYGKPVVDKLMDVGYNNILLRGELNGAHLKGSGNRNNPARNNKPNILFFSMDKVENGVAKRQGFVEMVDLLSEINEKSVPLVFGKSFNGFQQIIDECNNYFKENLIEGIVVRGADSKFSAKVMNLEYDSKK